MGIWGILIVVVLNCSFFFVRFTVAIRFLVVFFVEGVEALLVVWGGRYFRIRE